MDEPPRHASSVPSVRSRAPSSEEILSHVRKVQAVHIPMVLTVLRGSSMKVQEIPALSLNPRLYCHHGMRLTRGGPGTKALDDAGCSGFTGTI